MTFNTYFVYTVIFDIYYDIKPFGIYIIVFDIYYIKVFDIYKNDIYKNIIIFDIYQYFSGLMAFNISA